MMETMASTASSCAVAARILDSNLVSAADLQDNDMWELLDYTDILRSASCAPAPCSLKDLCCSTCKVEACVPPKLVL